MASGSEVTHPCTHLRLYSFSPASEVTSDLDIFNNEMATILGAPVYPAIGRPFLIFSIDIHILNNILGNQYDFSLLTIVLIFSVAQ